MENSINIWAMISLVVMTILLVETFHLIANKVMLYFNPPDTFNWPKKYLGRKIKYQHPVYKGQEVTGTIEAILSTKDKGKGGVPRYKFRINEGSNSFTDIFMDTKWEYVDAKNKP